MPKKAILVLFPGAIAYELATAAQVLSRKFAVEIATPTGDDHVDASGLTYRAHHAFADVAPAECACVLVAGGGLLSIKDNEPLNALLRRASERGVILGAICAGPLALAQAGVLAGHAYTQAGLYPASDQYRWDGAEFRAEPLVVSDHIITALPEAHIDFAIELGKRLGVFVDDDDASRQRGFYRGEYERDWTKVGAVKGL
jgi:protein deglycase